MRKSLVMGFWATAVATITIGAFSAGAGFSQSSGAAQGPPPEYEMTTYYVGLLYRGDNRAALSPEETKRIQEGHMAHIRKMADDGKLLVAGPFTDNTDLRGMFVFKVGSKEEAEQLTQADPAVKAGRLRFELHTWYAGKIQLAPKVSK